MNSGIVLIMTAMLSDGTFVQSPGFNIESMVECQQKGARIVSSYRGVQGIDSMQFRCYRVKDSLIIDPNKCQE